MQEQMAEWRERMIATAQGWLFNDLPPGTFPETVIIPFENPDLHQSERFLSPLTELRHFRSVTLGKLGDRPIGVLKSKLGAPAVALVVEPLARLGVRRIVGIGFCGGLQAEIHCGELVLPTAAIRDEGTTVHYLPSMFPAVPDLDLLLRLDAVAHLGSACLHRGIVWSTDAILMETSQVVRTWTSRGVIAVDMETSALFTVGHVAKVATAALLVASDNPASGVAADEKLLGDGLDAAISLVYTMARKLP